MRLQYRLILATFLPLLVFALLSAAVSAYALRQIPQELVLQRGTALAQVAAGGVAGNLRGYLRLLETVAAEMAGFTGIPQRQQQILADRDDVLAVFTAGAILLDAQGNAVAVTPAAEGARGLNYAFRPYFQAVKAAQAPVFSSVLQDYPAGFNAVIIAAPILRGGSFAGALLGEFALDRPEWARDLNLLQTPQGGRAYLIDSTATIIYHADAARIGVSIQTDPVLWRMVLGGEPRSMVYRPTGADGRPVVVSFAPIPGIAWGVITEEPWDAVLAAVIPYQWVVAGLMAFGIALALAALAFSLRRVTGPLNALVAEGQRVATGQPFHPLPIQGPPDLRTLLRVVNEMVARLGEQQAALRRYALQVLRGQEEERLRLSRDLHDQTVQDLVALSQRIELCADALEDDPAAAKARLSEVGALAQNTLAEVRRMSKDLRPFVLEDLGLAAALPVLAADLERGLPGAHVSCEIVGRAVRLPPELELTAYRIAQEALNNVRRHAAGATRVNVALFYEECGIQLMVEDDGRGFTLTDRETLVRGGRQGLVGMMERAQLFGGELEVATTPGAGTTVNLRLPWRDKADLQHSP